MQIAREKGALRFKDYRVELLKDLLTDALTRRREIKEIIKILLDSKIKYKWNDEATLTVFHRGKCFVALTIQAGWDLVEKLGLEQMEEEAPKGAVTPCLCSPV